MEVVVVLDEWKRQAAEGSAKVKKGEEQSVIARR
jgi:hypothetical protein